jgi:hypothetical protein
MEYSGHWILAATRLLTRSPERLATVPDPTHCRAADTLRGDSKAPQKNSCGQHDAHKHHQQRPIDSHTASG